LNQLKKLPTSARSMATLLESRLPGSRSWSNALLVAAWHFAAVSAAFSNLRIDEREARKRFHVVERKLAVALEGPLSGGAAAGRPTLAATLPTVVHVVTDAQMDRALTEVLDLIGDDPGTDREWFASHPGRQARLREPGTAERAAFSHIPEAGAGHLVPVIVVERSLVRRAALVTRGSPDCDAVAHLAVEPIEDGELVSVRSIAIDAAPGGGSVSQSPEAAKATPVTVRGNAARASSGIGAAKAVAV